MTRFFTAILILSCFVFRVSAQSGIDYQSYETDARLETVVQDMHHVDGYGIEDIAVSPDGKLIASLDDNAVKIWTSDGTLLRTVMLAGLRIGIGESVQFSPDGRNICIAGNNTDRAVIIDLTGRVVRTLRDGYMAVLDICRYSPDGKMVATGGTALRVWDPDTGKLFKKIKFEKPEGGTGSVYIRALAFSSDGSHLISGDDAGKIRIFDTSTWGCVRTIAAYGKEVQAVDVKPDGKSFAAAGRDTYDAAAVNMWSLDGTLLLSKKVDSPVNSNDMKIAFTPDGKKILGKFGGNSLSMMDLHGEILWTLENSYTFSIKPDGTGIYVGRSDYMPNSDTVYMGKRSYPLEQDDMEGRLINSFPGIVPLNLVHSVFSPDGSTFSILSRSKLLIWSRNGELKKIYPVNTDSYDNIEYSPDGRRIALPLRGDLHVFDVEGGEVKVLERTDEHRYIQKCAFSSDVGYIATLNYDSGHNGYLHKSTVSLWKSDGTFVREWFIEIGFDIQFSHDGKTIFVFYKGNSERGAKIFCWNIKGELIRTIEEERSFDRMTLTPDGKQILLTDRSIGKLINIDGTSAGMEIENDRFSTHKNQLVSFSPDGKRFVTLSEGHIQVWSLGGELLDKHTGKEGLCEKASFTPDGRFILGTGIDGTVRFYYADDVNRGSVSLFPSWNGEWFVLDHQGRFDCSSGGEDNVVFVRGMTVYNPEQFWNELFTPGLLAKYLAGENPEGKGVDDVVNHVPRVTIAMGGRDSDSVGKVMVTVTAESGEYDRNGFFLIQNGRVVDENTRGLVVVRNGRKRTFRVQLVEGKNTLQGGVYNPERSGYGVSSTVHASYVPDKVVPPDLYILAAGVSLYEDSALNLSSPAADAQAVCDLFSEIAEGTYQSVHVTELLNGAATGKEINNALESLTKTAGPQDAVIIFFAGHGFIEKGSYYFLPHDTDLTDISATGVDIESLGTFLGNLPANKIVLFLDTCQSGSAVRDLGRIAMSRSVEQRRQIAQLAKARGIAVLSASSADQQAYEIRDLKHGLFTYSILQAVSDRSEEVSIDGKISLSRLLSAVNSMTRDLAWKFLKIEQNPSLYIFGDDFFLGTVPE